MKKTIALILVFVLCLAALTGCGRSAAAASEPTAAPTEAPTATPAPTPAPTATPEPPSTVPDPTPAPDGKNGMYDLLTGVFDTYHPGTAGSSLTAAWYAASIVDFTAKNGAAAAEAGARAWDRGLVTEFGETLQEKLNLMYSTALALVGPYRDVLTDAGYVDPLDYAARDVHSAYRALYPALGLGMPAMVLVWYPDANAEHLTAMAIEVMDLTADGLTSAMADSVLWGGSTIQSLKIEGSTVRADMNDAFAAQIGSMGSSGETMILGGLVNTLLDALDAEEVILTVNGQPLETGHDVYDYPLGRYEGSES